MFQLQRYFSGARLISHSTKHSECSPSSIARSRAIFFSAFLAASATAFAAEAEGPSAQIAPASVSARGEQSAVLSLKAFGRYSVTVESSQGVALQAVDKMSGAGPIVGTPGKQDGRLDLFLDRGSYKIVTRAAKQGSGRAKLAAHSFRELNGARPPRMVEEKLERATLGDFEQRSYWLEVKEQRTVAIEAAGRHLADLRLWRDGVWLVETTPEMSASQARVDHPLSVARFTARLEPGLYLVTAYGGPSQPWTDASEEKPFLLRFGIPKAPATLRQQFTMGEFGVERFLVPSGPNFFRLELPVAANASLQVSSYDEGNPFQANGPSASIDKRSLPPVVELGNVGSSGLRVVTVTMEAGKSFVLQHFNAASSTTVNAGANYWISSIHAGHADDSIGATAILTRSGPYIPEEYVDAQVVELARGKTWHRRFNLLDELTLFVKVNETSKISVVGQGVKARYRFEPFVTSRPRDYKTPNWQESGHEFELDRGLYVLTVDPETRGILDLQLLPPGSLLTKAMSFVSNLTAEKNQSGEPDVPSKEGLTPVNAVARFADARLGNAGYYTVYLNRQPGVASGIVVRSLPINLDEALPVTQRAGERLTIPVQVSEPGTLRAIAEDGRTLEIALDNGKKGAALDVGAGLYSVTIRETNAVQDYSLALEPTRLSSKTPLPPMPDATLASLPKFPTITSAEPYYFDLERNSTRSFKVHVDKPGLYQFETTGLLHTGGKVRTRINPALFSNAENGVGRNFMIQNYLREGDYQLTVNTAGQTAGHLGVQLTRTEVVDGGELRAGEVARALLPSAQALSYRFKISRRGAYRLQAMGLGRNFRLRLEDANGWPVFAPERDGDFTEELKPGNYRLIVLPQTAEARVLTRLVSVTGKKSYKGHGPHRIALEQRVEHTWVEPAKGAARTPDQWEFDLPGAADISIALDNEMEGALVNTADLKNVVAKVDAKRGWSGRLPAGRYRVLAKHSRSNNHMPYTLQVSSTQLLAGQSREVLAPAVIPLSVGKDGLVELQSFGPGDVRARLLDAAGETVAQNDDRADDWNFHIAQRLRPGEYKLLVDPVNEQQTQTSVAMHAPGEVAEKPLALGSTLDIKDDQVHVYPLAIPAERNLLLASAQSSDTVGLALEGESAQGWVNLGTTLAKAPHLALPLGAERFRSYRLRAWSADRRSLKMRVRAVAATVPASSEGQLQGGMTLARVDESRADLRVARVTLSRPGTFRIKGDLARLQWSDGSACTDQVSNNAVIGVSGNTLWLLAEQGSEDDGVSFSGERLRTPDGDNESLRLELMPGRGGVIDLQPNAKGPSLIIAQAGAGQPGVAMSQRANPDAIGLVPGAAVTVAMHGTTDSVYVWNAASPGAAIELDVRQVPLQRGNGASLGMGMRDDVIGAKTALPLRLPSGALSVRLTLPPQNAAVFLKRGSVLSTHWSGDDALQETVATDADELWLLNADTHSSHYGIEITQDGTGKVATLKPGELLEHNVSTAGRLRVPVEITKTDADPVHLHVNGNAQVLWLEKGGRVASGNDIAIRDSGVLWLQHQPGTLVAWLDAPQRQQSSQGFAEWFKALRETTVKPPQTVSLTGKSQILTLQLERPTMLHVRTSVPVVTHYLINGKSAQTEAHLQGANINLLAPAGSSRLVLRAVGTDSLSGVANVMTTEVTPLNEGAGPEVLLAPASARLFSFEIGQRTAVGIGIRASSDIVRSTLYDASGTVQAQGVVQMPTLQAGRYYLAIETPADTAPVLVQPIVFGLSKPDTRPPYDILRRYVEGKGADAIIYDPHEAEAAPAPAAKTARRKTRARPVDENGEYQSEDEESEQSSEEQQYEEQPPEEQPSEEGEQE
ncbi:MAG TPA: hypothetical protein VIU93_10135 [Gallionellaceae bacterium]